MKEIYCRGVHNEFFNLIQDGASLSRNDGLITYENILND